MPTIKIELVGDQLNVGLPTRPIVRVRLSKSDLTLLRRTRDLLNKVIDSLPFGDDEMYDRDDHWHRAANSLSEIIERNHPASMKHHTIQGTNLVASGKIYPNTNKLDVQQPRKFSKEDTERPLKRDGRDGEETTGASASGLRS